MPGLTCRSVPFEDPAVDRVLAAADHAYVTVGTRDGPHSTPEVHLWWAGRVWLAVARDTVKARALRRNRAAGVLVRAGEDSVVIAGEARPVDPLRPMATLQNLPELVLSGPATAGYISRNYRDLLGFLSDALANRFGARNPAFRLLLAIRPLAVAHVQANALARVWGAWPEPAGASPGGGEGMASPENGFEPSVPDVSEMPEATARLFLAERPCVVGWSSPLGPVGLPGTWDPKTHKAVVPTSLFRLAALSPTSPASITLDAVDARHPAGKHGAVVRGKGAAHLGPATTAVSLRGERTTWWRGFSTSSTGAAGNGRVRPATT